MGAVNAKDTDRSSWLYLNGVQALIRLLAVQGERDRRAGLRSAGFVSGYQGSPLNHVDREFHRQKDELENYSVKFQAGQNEDLALTSVWGSQQVSLYDDAKYDGVFGMWYGKWAGLARCGDALLHGNSAGSAKHGGVLLVCGDDHAARSSSIATQSEYILTSALIPVLVPSGVQDYLDFGVHGWAMSRFSGSWIGLKALDDTVESSASVDVSPDRVISIIPRNFVFPDDGVNLRFPDQPLAMERRIYDYRLPAVIEYARVNKLNKVVLDAPRARLGIISAGKSYLDVMQSLRDLGISQNSDAEKCGIRVAKIGLSWPLDPEFIATFSEGLDEILVVEEKRPFIEGQVKEILYNVPGGSRPNVLGKQKLSGTHMQPGNWLLPPTADLSSALVGYVIGERIMNFMDSEPIAKAVRRFEESFGVNPLTKIAPKHAGFLGDAGRVPYFCSGCPHSTSTRVPNGSQTIAGVGCHFMASYIFPGTRMFSHMGAEGAAWIGHAPFTERQHIFANMGDGTYHHSGILSVRAAIAANVNITFKILYNDATAATGGQRLNASLSVPGIAQQLYAEGVSGIIVVTDEPDKYPTNNPFPPGVDIRHRDELDAIQKDFAKLTGVTALIYDQTCAAEKRRRRKIGAYPVSKKLSFINHRVCEGCGDCNTKSNCVSVLPLETEFGRKRVIDQTSCNQDLSCLRGFCPSYVVVEGATLKKPSGAELPGQLFAEIPGPNLPKVDGTFALVIAGIGGTGIITIGAILGMAAHLSGKGVSVLDMTGVAQKGGAVSTHVQFSDNPESIHSSRIAPGEADALIGCDLVVSCDDSVLSLMRAGSTKGVINTSLVPTVAFVKDPDERIPFLQMTNGLRSILDTSDRDWVNATNVTRQLMGSTLTSNMFLLGCAYQKSLVPVSRDAIFQAIEINGIQVQDNKDAFKLGQLYVHQYEKVEQLMMRGENDSGAMSEQYGTPSDRIERRYELLKSYQNRRYADRYRRLAEAVRKAESELAIDSSELTEAVLQNFFKLAAYKDEYEVARLHTDGELERQLRKIFDGNFKVSYSMAPPMLTRHDPKIGEPSKITFGPWLRPVLRILSQFKFLRGTPFDPFGYTKERRMERGLVEEYEKNVTDIIGSLTASNHRIAVEYCSLPIKIRGFGHVKERNVEEVQAQQKDLLIRFFRDAGQTANVAAE